MQLQPNKLNCKGFFPKNIIVDHNFSEQILFLLIAKISCRQSLSCRRMVRCISWRYSFEIFHCSSSMLLSLYYHGKVLCTSPHPEISINTQSHPADSWLCYIRLRQCFSPVLSSPFWQNVKKFRKKSKKFNCRKLEFPSSSFISGKRWSSLEAGHF